MAKRTARDWALLGRVWAELGSGRITEAFIKDGRKPRKFVYSGLTSENGHVTVNPQFHVVEVVIHEMLHRLHPEWSERYIRRTTTYLRRRMSDEEVQAMYSEFQRRARKRQRIITTVAP